MLALSYDTRPLLCLEKSVRRRRSMIKSNSSSTWISSLLFLGRFLVRLAELSSRLS